MLWVRLKLPFRLNHVNIYLLADGDGWAMVDSGFGNEDTIAAWTTLFEGPLKGVKITRLIVTHSHPDHVGLAGWIVERFSCPLHMSQIEYLQSVYHQNRTTEERVNAQRLFFRRHGMDENLTDKLLGRGQDYLKQVSVLPPSYHRISHGDEIFDRHAALQGHHRRRPFARSGDAVLRRRQTVPLGRSGAEQDLAQCQRLGGRAGRECARLVSALTGEPHHDAARRRAGAARPRRAVLRLEDPHQAIGRSHHEDRCDLIAEACRDVPQTSKELVPVVFHKHVLDAHQIGFAAGELIAHVNYMLVRGPPDATETTDGVLRFRTT